MIKGLSYDIISHISGSPFVMATNTLSLLECILKIAVKGVLI